MKTKILKYLWTALGVIYFPVYIVFWLLHKVARFILAIAYFGLLDFRISKDIIKSLFKWHGEFGRH